MALPLLWVVCAIAGWFYAAQQHIALPVAARIFPAFLLEATFYYALAADKIRARIEKFPSASTAFGLTVVATAPYTCVAAALGFFDWRSFLGILGLAAVASFWYVVLPRAAVSDILFLCFFAAVVLAKVFHRLYANPAVPKPPLEDLGMLMWVRTGAIAMLCVRRVTGIGFGFWPRNQDWKIGALYYAGFVAVATGIAWKIGFATPRIPPAGWQSTTVLTVATFFGVLWVLALGEEFFFRGLLQQWISGWLKSPIAGLIVTSLLFGGAHLWFRAFPNWRFALLATIAGVFYGLAFQQAKSIRASMVTHALVVTTWRIFFS